MTRSGTKGPYDDFSGLAVTVHQTEHLRAQAVDVTWTGGAATRKTSYDYLQIMQCWGDDPAGPRREQCVYGAANGVFGTYTDRRELPEGTDPAEQRYADSSDGVSNPFVPFTPVDGPPTGSSFDWTYFAVGDTNEQYFARTQSDGTGEVAFEVQTAQRSPGLGCGDTRNGTTAPRSCRLVVVPRGGHEPDGSTGDGNRLNSSPLSTSNWNQRIVFPLHFDQVGTNCPADKPERRIIGAELATEAVTSWQSKLCAGNTARYTFSKSGEQHARDQITTPSASSPEMALTVDPVRMPEGAPPVVHAPVALGGLTIGFFREDEHLPGGRARDVKLNQRLLAKILSESSVWGVRLIVGGISPPLVAPPHLAGNPVGIVEDPEFRELSPPFKNISGLSRAPPVIMVTADNSDANKPV